MCQATVYRIDETQNREVIAPKIAHLYQEGGEVVLTDARGEEIRVRGAILGADLLRNAVYIGDARLIGEVEEVKEL